MKTKIGIVILVAACVGLLIAVFATKKAAEDQRRSDAESIIDYSNQVTAANISLDDLRQVNLMLTNDLSLSRESLVTLSNSLNEAVGTLTNTKAMLQNAEGQIVDLEAQNKLLDERAASLTNSIESLNAQMAETQQKLASADTNNAFLNAELQKQIALRAELERKFNNLDAVRTQVKKLRNDEFVARRLQWLRNGTDPSMSMKGAQQLMQHSLTAKTASPTNGHYDLNVEVGSDGSVKVSTNAPAQ
jgi:chromosome segregation ATPase